MYKAFDVLPEMKMTPHDAWQQELRGEVREIPLAEMVNEISANMILPYPPGVPVVLPGEMVTEQSRPVLDFLEMLCEIGNHFPGFETDIHGVYNVDGVYKVKVIKR
jgi:lysine decarboxylase